MKKPTFSEETRLKVYFRQEGKCFNCGESTQIMDFHHILSNTVINRKLYGDLIQSDRNCRGVDRKCHTNHAFWDKQLKKDLEQTFKNELILAGTWRGKT